MKFKKSYLITAIAALCVLILCIGTSSQNFTSGIKKLKFSTTTDKIELKVNEVTTGYFEVEGNTELIPENIKFVSKQSSIATFEYDKSYENGKIYYKIKGIIPGETNVHIETADGSTKSAALKVIVLDEKSASDNVTNTQKPDNPQKVAINSVPAYSNDAYIKINNNVPNFKAADYTTKSYEFYSELDSMGRCGFAMACIGKDIMPTEKMGNIGQVKPTGWHTVKYDNVDGKYLYNRCHLIGYQLSAENANKKNLITGTRYLNIQGMLPFENMVADYVKETNNHVLYRVTPIFDGNNLLSNGVQIEGYSVEDKGEGICFNVFAYNAQPGIKINYLTGESSSSNNSNSGRLEKEEEPKKEEPVTYVLNQSTKVFHRPGCGHVIKIKEVNKKSYNGSKEDLVSQGYRPCKVCNP